MSCNTCEDCDNITLPGTTGPSGPTGPTGADGSDGTSGTSVLHNDIVQSTTASASIALFNATKAYTLPLGTLSTNGSKLVLTSMFSTTDNTGVGISTAYIYFAGASFTGKSFPFSLRDFKENLFLKVVLEITRVSPTELFVLATTNKSSASSGQVLESYSFKESTIIVADLDANSLLIEARGVTTGTATFNCDQLTIDHLIK